MKKEIEIKVYDISVKELKRMLQESNLNKSEVNYVLKSNPPKLRGVDPTVLIALIGAGGTSLGIVIGGILRLIEKRQQKTEIRITGKTGRKIEIFGEVTNEQIEKLVKYVKELDVDRIEIESK